MERAVRVQRAHALAAGRQSGRGGAKRESNDATFFLLRIGG